MDSELLRILSEELRETKNIARAAQQHADAAMLTAQEAKRQADAAWELVIITRNQVTTELAYLKLPWWRKLFGQTAN